MVGESSSLGLGGPSLPGLGPTREVPHEHHDLVRCPRPRRAGVHQHTAAGISGFLTGYSGLTREAYELDLRQYASLCRQHHLRLFEGRRADIECFARDLEARGRARATITRRLCTVAGFYRYASRKTC